MVSLGSKNPRWNGGISEYPGHAMFKRNRIIKMALTNWTCELCREKARYAHHVDKTKDNHEITNLQAVCAKCHCALHKENIGRPRKHNQLVYEISKKTGLSVFTIARYISEPERIRPSKLKILIKYLPSIEKAGLRI